MYIYIYITRYEKNDHIAYHFKMR